MSDPSSSQLPSQADIERALADFADPETGRGVIENAQVRDLKIDGPRVSLGLALTTHSAPLWDETCRALVARLTTRFPALKEVKVDLAVLDRPPQPRGELGITVKSIIAVGSGKGGVGKSTIAASLALGLSKAGSKVGLLDADVYGPSIPHLLGATGKPEVVNSRIQPVDAAGLKMISIGLLVAPGEAVVWRGPMLHHTLTQFLRDVAWGPLDYLVIDMPPGTGDVALSLSQLVPLTGAVVVCTPQDVALLDAVKAVAMFRKVNIPVLGMVENMSGFVCPECGKRYDIFGSGGAKRRAADLNIPFLGEVPITISIRVNGDAGQTTANFTDPQAAPYLEAIVKTLVRNLSEAGPAAAPLPTLKV
ncbi:MAG TPA: Mrp/NBP35 family ATP-binding protein [Pirellulales bacterium]|jgi:ATP-binding protein involved in chromosome partitioning|nr:Mrp/NBP35 family ATP-binding protein [Pirellulales bacterium]